MLKDVQRVRFLVQRDDRAVYGDYDDRYRNMLQEFLWHQSVDIDLDELETEWCKTVGG